MECQATSATNPLGGSLSCRLTWNPDSYATRDPVPLLKHASVERRTERGTSAAWRGRGTTSAKQRTKARVRA